MESIAGESSCMKHRHTLLTSKHTRWLRLESEPIDLAAAFSRCSQDGAFADAGRVGVPQNTGIVSLVR